MEKNIDSRTYNDEHFETCPSNLVHQIKKAEINEAHLLRCCTMFCWLHDHVCNTTLTTTMSQHSADVYRRWYVDQTGLEHKKTNTVNKQQAIYFSQ